MSKNSINEKLFNLQQEIGTISKDAKNPFYKSKYFDVNSLINQLQPLLKSHRLLLLQPIEEDLVYSKIICVDGGGSVISALKLPELNDPQKLGSAITYYRRYTLASLLGLQAVDDDGNLGSGKVESQVEKKWLNENTKEFSQVVERLQAKTITAQQLKQYYRISNELYEKLLKL